jgi:hypothetical protein
MAVRIGSARIDENGNAYGGKAGDQTGKEVATQAWYRHSKGWVVLRAKDPAAREKIARCMEMACENDRIGYDQHQRNTLYEAAREHGFDVSKVTKNVETDCSALVRVCVNYAGIRVGNFYTANQATVLMATGAFVRFDDDAHTKRDANLLRGDILVTRTKGHTVVVLTDGANAAAERKNDAAEEIAPAPAPVPAPVEGKTVAVTAYAVNIRAGNGTKYDRLDIARRGDVLVWIATAENGWHAVEYGDRVAWISGKHTDVRG